MTTVQSQSETRFAMTEDGRRRVVIEHVTPEVDAGRYPVKRTVGERVVVEADAFTDGHDALSCVLLHRNEQDSEWQRTPMLSTGPGLDRWRGSFLVGDLGKAYYTVQAWVDRFHTWRRDVQKKANAGQNIHVDMMIGAQLLDEAAERAEGEDADRLAAFSKALLLSDTAVALAADPELLELMDRYPDTRLATMYGRELEVTVDRERARFSSWYELFPRSCAPSPGQHGTLADCEARLPYVASMGFDVLYLPPIHPIGRDHRKGRNNATTANPNDTGSPWAIGAKEGGHKSIHPQLGTLEDFRRLIKTARGLKLEIAMDIAYQCAPDHPYVAEHQNWFRTRPDGSVQYAENPPKKYQDIYPFDFETDQWQELWEELKSVVLFWIEQGVHIFRVDNPHTKPFPFWEWLIGEVKRDHPDIIFLAEAFTRPKVMACLAKAGFTQSYTYFTWRNTRREITEYFHTLTKTDLREIFRPNAWPNTPDILPEFLQTGGRPAFMSRLVLAATLSANYGIYGPAFEFCDHVPREHGSEEYLDSEKYEIRCWDPSRQDTLRPLIARVNRIRQENVALQYNWSLEFHNIDNEQLIAYTKTSEDGSNIILTIVNLDPYHTHSGWVELPLEQLGLENDRAYQVHDLLSDARYLWQGPRNFVQLNPAVIPAHIFRLRRRVRTEREFEYFM